MNKKDYEAIAKIISGYKSFHSNPLIFVEAAIADYCRKNNPRFDRGKFYEACK